MSCGITLKKPHCKRSPPKKRLITDQSCSVNTCKGQSTQMPFSAAEKAFSALQGPSPGGNVMTQNYGFQGAFVPWHPDISAHSDLAEKRISGMG